jgi:hypothetical protein
MRIAITPTSAAAACAITPPRSGMAEPGGSGATPLGFSML